MARMVSPVRRKYEEFRSFLQSVQAQKILNAFDRNGGDAGLLRSALWELRERCYEPVLPNLQTLQKMKRLDDSLNVVGDLAALKKIDPALWTCVTKLVAALRKALRPTVSYLDIQEKLHAMSRSVKRAGRPFTKLIPKIKVTTPKRTRGYTFESVIAAVAVEAFRRTYGKQHPRFRVVASLLYEAIPSVFSDFDGDKAADLLARRVRRIPRKLVEREFTRRFDPRP